MPIIISIQKSLDERDVKKKSVKNGYELKMRNTKLKRAEAKINTINFVAITGKETRHYYLGNQVHSFDQN